MKKGLLLFILAIAAHFSMAEDNLSPPTGNEILAVCQMEPRDAAACDTLFMAIVVGVMKEQRSGPNPLICMPNGSTIYQAILVVKRKFETAPQMLHFPAHDIAVYALYEAFPCQRK